MRRPGEEPARGGKPSAHPLGEDLSKVYSGRERWPRPEGAKTNPPADSSLIRRRGPACIVEGEARGSRGPVKPILRDAAHPDEGRPSMLNSLK